MKAAYAPLTFSWRGAHSGGWPVGVLVALPRKELEVIWRPPPQVLGAAQGGFDLDSTLEAFEERLKEAGKSKTGSSMERLEAVASGWSFGTVQIGESAQIEGPGEDMLEIAVADAGL